MNLKVVISLLLPLLVCIEGCGRKNIKYGYAVQLDGEIIVSVKLMLPNKLNEKEIWKSLEGLELEEPLWDEQGFRFTPDENEGKVMTLRGEIRIFARGEFVELNELRFVKQKGTHGSDYITPSGWIIDPKQIPEIIKLPKKEKGE